LENLSDGKDINRAWENIKENIKTTKKCPGVHKLKQHKPWFDEECLHFIDQRKQTKMQWLQDPSQSIVDNMNSVRREASRHFRNRKEECLETEIKELEINCKVKNIRDLCRGSSDFRECYRHRTDTVNVERGDLVAHL
jgi:hypothetical protein